MGRQLGQGMLDQRHRKAAAHGNGLRRLHPQSGEADRRGVELGVGGGDCGMEAQGKAGGAVLEVALHVCLHIAEKLIPKGLVLILQPGLKIKALPFVGDMDPHGIDEAHINCNAGQNKNLKSRIDLCHRACYNKEKFKSSEV